MTTANKITISRMVLIPIFVVFAAYYSQSIRNGSEILWLRIAALASFGIAALSDALDGYIARNFNQSTALGRVLDPVADKLLLLSGIIVLSVTDWQPTLPIWFAVLVISRDIVIVVGVLIIQSFIGKVKMRPLITSKICTFLQLSCVCWVLLDFWSVEARPIPLDLLICFAAIFTLISGVQYVREGIDQLREAGHTLPE